MPNKSAPAKLHGSHDPKCSLGSQAEKLPGEVKEESTLFAPAGASGWLLVPACPADVAAASACCCLSSADPMAPSCIANPLLSLLPATSAGDLPSVPTAAKAASSGSSSEALAVGGSVTDVWCCAAAAGPTAVA